MRQLIQPYRAVSKLVAQYWKTYGGWQDLLLSPYLHASIFLLVITRAAWIEQGWWNQVQTVVPSLLGFSLGTLAIFLGFGSDRFRKVISGRDPEATSDISPYMSVTAAFTHFIIVQVAAVIFSVACAAVYKLPLGSNSEVLVAVNKFARIAFWGFSYWLFLYALCLAAASVLAVFRVAGWYDQHQTKERKEAKLHGDADEHDA